MSIQPQKHLQELGLSESEIAVYLGMVSGSRTARDLVKSLGLKRPTVYYALGCLERRGLVSKTGVEGSSQFSLEPVEKLLRLAKEKVDDASKLEDSIASMLPVLKQESYAENAPGVAFFEGIDAVKRAIMDMLYTKKRVINSVIPENNFFWEVGEEFVGKYVQERIKREIHTRNLWEAQISKDVLKKYYAEFSEVRILPAIMKNKFHTSIFLYDDKVLQVSSAKNSYCIVITSQEYHDTMQAWFEGLWTNSNPHAA
jgi:sugar-specific transcriptional regulator TrmB